MDEDRVLHALLIAICVPVVLAAVASGGTFGPGQTLAALLGLFGAIGLVRGFAHDRPLIPRACSRKRR